METEQLSLSIKPENRKKFEKAMMGWKTLIQLIGWDALCDMRVRRVPPFQGEPKLTGHDQRGQAKRILLNELAQSLKEAGLEVK